MPITIVEIGPERLPEYDRVPSNFLVRSILEVELVDGGLGGIRLPDLHSEVHYYATHIQVDELSATKDETRRTSLLQQFFAIGPMRLPTESFVYDVSRWDLAKWGDGILFPQIKALLDARNHAKSSNIQDALIAETAIKNSLTLVSEDADLLLVVSQLGGSAVRVGQIDPSGSRSEALRG